MRVQATTTSFRRKEVVEKVTVTNLKQSQISQASDLSLSISRSQKSLSQDAPRSGLKSGRATLAQKIEQQPTDIEKLKRENVQLKIMALSQDARQNLLKMQRFDRYIYPLQSDRILKKPIEQELKRLQIIKNQQKQMRGQYYDNELTITALYNHIKLVWEMNRELEERQKLRKEKDDAVLRLHEQKRESLKEVRELKERIRMAGGKLPSPEKIQKQETVSSYSFTKEELTTINLISATIRSKRYSDCLQQIKRFIPRISGAKPEICRQFELFVPVVEDVITAMVQVKTVETRLNETIVFIERISKLIRETRYQEIERVMIQTLKVSSEHRSFGLMVECVLNMRKNYETSLKKKTTSDELRTPDKNSQKMVQIEEEVKVLREQINKQKSISAQYMKNKQILQRQIQKYKADFEKLTFELQSYKKQSSQQSQVLKLKVEIENFKKMENELNALKKSESEQKRLKIKVKSIQDELKIRTEEISKLRHQNISKQEQITKLSLQIQSIKKLQVDNRQINLNIKKKEEQNRELTKQIGTLRAKVLQTQRANQKLQKTIVELRAQIQKAKSSQFELEEYKKAEAEASKITTNVQAVQQQLLVSRQQTKKERELKRVLQQKFDAQFMQVQNLKKVQAEHKRALARIKQYEEEVGSLKVQLAASETSNNQLKQTIGTLDKNQAKIKAQLQNNRNLLTELDRLRKSEAESRKSIASYKSIQVEYSNVSERLTKEAQEKKLLQKQVEQKILQLESLKKVEMESKRVASRLKQTEEELKTIRQQNNSLRNGNNQNVKKIQALEKANQKLRLEVQRKNNVQSQLQNYRKTQLEQKKVISTFKNTEEQLKYTKQQLNRERSIRIGLKQQIDALQLEIEQVRKGEAESKRSLSKLKLIEQQLDRTRQQFSNAEQANSELSKQNKVQEKQIQQLKVESERGRKAQEDLNQLRKAQAESKKIVSRAKINEQQIKTLKEQMSSEKQQKSQLFRAKQKAQRQVQKSMLEIEQLRKIQLQYEQLKLKEGEFRRSSQKIKLYEEQIRKLREELESEKNRCAQLLKTKAIKQKEMEKLRLEIIEWQNEDQSNKKILARLPKIEQQAKANKDKLNELRSQLVDKTKLCQQLELINQKLRRSENQLVALKQNQKDSKLRENVIVQNLKEQCSTLQLDLTYTNSLLDKLNKIFSVGKVSGELQKAKKQLIASKNPSSKKWLALTDFLIKKQAESVEIQMANRQSKKELNDKTQKIEVEKQKIHEQLTDVSKNAEILCQALKSIGRLISRTKGEQLFLNKKLVQIIAQQLKKGNHSHNLEPIQMQIVNVGQSIYEVVTSQFVRLEDNFQRKIEQKQKQVQKVSVKEKQTTETVNEKVRICKNLENQIIELQNLLEQSNRQHLNLKKQFQRIQREYHSLANQKKILEEELAHEAEKLSKTSKESMQLKKENQRLLVEKEALDSKNQEAGLQISRLKKCTSEFVQQQKKVLQTLQTQGKQKQKYQRELQQLSRELEKTEKQRQYLERKCKNMEADVLRLKQLEIMFENTVHESEMQVEIMSATISNKDKQIKNLKSNIKDLSQERANLDKQVQRLESQAYKQKAENDKTKRFVGDKLELVEKQRADLARQIEKLNQQIQFEVEERQNDRKHYTLTISKMERSIKETQLQHSQEIEGLNTKIAVILRQKEHIRQSMQVEQQQYRQKLLQVSRNLQSSSSQDQKQKAEMKRQIDRLSSQLDATINKGEAERRELQRAVETMRTEKQIAAEQHRNSLRILQEEIERVRTSEYQANYEKIKRQRQQMRKLQFQVDKLNEALDVKESHLARAINENKRIYQHIAEYQLRQKEYERELSSCRQKLAKQQATSGANLRKYNEVTKYIENLQNQIREFELVNSIKTRQTSSLVSIQQNYTELQQRLEAALRQNIQLKVVQESQLNQITRMKQEAIQLRSQNTAIDRELYASKARPDFSRQEVVLQAKLEQNNRKLTEMSEEYIRYKVESTNYERMLRDRENELRALAKLQEDSRKLNEERLRENNLLGLEKSRLEAKINQLQKNHFIREAELQKQIENLSERVLESGRYSEENVRIRSQVSSLNHQVLAASNEANRLQKQVFHLTSRVEQKDKAIAQLQRDLDHCKDKLAARDSEVYGHFMSINRSITESAQQKSIVVPDVSGTISLLERIGEERKKDIDRLQQLIGEAQRKYEEKALQAVAQALQLKHLKLQRDLIDDNWRQKSISENQTNKQLRKQVESLRTSLELNRQHFSNELFSLKIEKQKLLTRYEDLQQRFNILKAENEKTLRESYDKDQNIKQLSEKAQRLARQYESAQMNTQRLEAELNQSILKLKGLTSQLQNREEFYRKQVELLKQYHKQDKNVIAKENASLNKVLAQKQSEIRTLVSKLTTYSDEVSNSMSSRQMESMSKIIILERIAQELKKDNAKMEHQKQTLTARLEEKARESSQAALTIKQLQMQKLMVEEQFKLKFQGQTNKNNELAREIDSLKQQLKNSTQIYENERHTFRVQTQRIQKTLSQLRSKTNLLHESLQKAKLQKAALSQRQLVLRNQLQHRQRQIQKYYDSQSRHQSASRKTRSNNKQLQEILQLLDQEYVIDSEGQNQIRTLMKISEEVTHLLDRNKLLEKKLNRSSNEVTSVDEQWFVSVEGVVESVLDYLHSIMLTKYSGKMHFISSVEFRLSKQSPGSSRERYLSYVAGFIRQLFQGVVSELSQNAETYDETFRDIRKYVQLFTRSGDSRYIDSLQKCLSHFPA